MTTTTIPATAPLRTKDKLALGVLNFFSRRSLRFLHLFGLVIGWLGTHVFKNRQRHILQTNLQLCFPTQSADWHKITTERCMISMAQSIMEFTKCWGEPPSWSLAQIRKVHNEHLFHEALAAGKGTIGIVPHYGSWEIMNAWLNLHVEPIIMYKPVKSKAVDSFVRNARSRLKSTAVPTDERGVKALFKGLKQNGFTAILPDHVPHDQGGIHVPFFGINTFTGVIVPKLLAKTGSRAVVMYCLRRPHADGYEIFFVEPDVEIYSPDLATATAALNRSVEAVIRLDPAHYQWGYKRFQLNETLPYPY
jgi:KDO2-lipid IV(A) lauroyltransferase